MSARALAVKTADDPEKIAQEIDTMIQEVSQEYMDKYENMSVPEVVLDSLLEIVEKRAEKGR